MAARQPNETAKLTALALPAGTAAGSLSLTGRPEALVRTPDGATLLVLDQGPGKDKGESGYQATGKSSVTIVDAASLQVRSRIELGFGILGGEIPTGLLSPDGQRLVLVCPGYESKNPGESLIRELRADLQTAQDKYGDAGTCDFFTGLMEKHEKMAWMLRSYVS